MTNCYAPFIHLLRSNYLLDARYSSTCCAPFIHLLQAIHPLVARHLSICYAPFINLLRAIHPLIACNSSTCCTPFIRSLRAIHPLIARHASTCCLIFYLFLIYITKSCLVSPLFFVFHVCGFVGMITKLFFNFCYLRPLLQDSYVVSVMFIFKFSFESILILRLKENFPIYFCIQCSSNCPVFQILIFFNNLSSPILVLLVE